MWIHCDHVADCAWLPESVQGNWICKGGLILIRRYANMARVKMEKSHRHAYFDIDSPRRRVRHQDENFVRILSLLIYNTLRTSQPVNGVLWRGWSRKRFKSSKDV